MEFFKGNLASVINYFFQTILITYLVLLLLEQVWPGLVSTYFRLNYLLIIVIIAGIFDVFSEHLKKPDEKIRTRDYIFITILGILGFAIIKFKTDKLGFLSWIISIIAGILIILLSILVLQETEKIKSEWNYNTYNDTFIDEYSFRNFLAEELSSDRIAKTFKIELEVKKALRVELTVGAMKTNLRIKNLRNLKS